jgi:hypothetical protein
VDSDVLGRVAVGFMPVGGDTGARHSGVEAVTALLAGFLERLGQTLDHRDGATDRSRGDHDGIGPDIEARDIGLISSRQFTCRDDALLTMGVVCDMNQNVVQCHGILRLAASVLP